MKSVSVFVDEERTFDLELGKGQFIRVTYDPREVTITPEETEARRDSKEPQNGMADDLARAMIAWDVSGPVPMKDRPGQPAGSLVAEDEMIPFDPKILSYLPNEFLYNVMLAITWDTQNQLDPDKLGKKLQPRGSTRTSMKSNSNGATESHSPVGSTTG